MLSDLMKNMVNNNDNTKPETNNNNNKFKFNFKVDPTAKIEALILDLKEEKDASERATIMEQIEAKMTSAIKGLELQCPKCNKSARFQSSGVGGAVSENSWRKVQVKCCSCNAKTYLEKVILVNEEEKASKPLVTQMKVAYNAWIANMDGCKPINKKRKQDNGSKSISAFFQENWEDKYYKEHEKTKKLEKLVMDLIQEVKELKRMVNAAAEAPVLANISEQMTTQAPALAAELVSPMETPKTSLHTYADKAKKNIKIKKKSIMKAAAQAIAPKAEPVEFGKLRFLINNSRALKVQKPRPVIRAILKTLKIEKKTFDFSKIGNSVVEIYYPKTEETFIKDAIKAKNLVLINEGVMQAPAFGQMNQEIKTKIINRLTSLYRFNKLKKLRECILEGYTPEIQEEVLTKVHEMHNGSTLMEVETPRQTQVSHDH